MKEHSHLLRTLWLSCKIGELIYDSSQDLRYSFGWLETLGFKPVITESLNDWLPVCNSPAQYCLIYLFLNTPQQDNTSYREGFVKREITPIRPFRILTAIPISMFS